MIKDKKVEDFLKSAMTCVEGYDFAEPDELEAMPPGSAERISELEEMLIQISMEAADILIRRGGE